MAIATQLDGQPWLVDVGREEELFDPVPIIENRVTLNFVNYVRLVRGRSRIWAYQTSADSVNFSTELLFPPKESKFIEFLHLHEEMQTIYRSRHSETRSISRVADSGRLTLNPTRMWLLQGRVEVDSEVVRNEQDFDSRLLEAFGIKWRALIQAGRR